MIGDEKEPVAAPGDIAGEAAKAGYFDRNGSLVAITRHVGNRDTAVGMETCGDLADGGFDLVLAGLDAAEIRERSNHADGAVAAHPEKAHVVEEDDRGGGVRLDRLKQQRSDDHLGAARLAHYSRAKAVVLRAKEMKALLHRARAKVRTAGNHDAGRLALGMRVDDLD